jgi:DNA helicase HerA-like ATPase
MAAFCLWQTIDERQIFRALAIGRTAPSMSFPHARLYRKFRPFGQSAAPQEDGAMDIHDRVHLVPGDEPHRAVLGDEPSFAAAGAVGRLVAVSGSQATMQFSIDPSAPREPDTEVTVGSLVGIQTGTSLAIGALCEVSLQDVASGQRGSDAIGRIDLLGEIICDALGERHFHRGIMVYPQLGSTVIPIGNDALQIIFDSTNPHTIEVGRLQQNDAIAAFVNIDEIVQKHFAIVGSTGSGKSTALALVLRKIMEARGDLRVLLIDAHNEYAHCFDDRAQVFDPGNLKLPFWLFNFDEIVEIIFGSRTQADHEVSLLAELIPLAKNDYARSRTAGRGAYRPSLADGGRYTVDTPVPYRLDDLIASAESRMGKLENGDIAIQYQRLVTRINAVRKNPRYAFIFEDATSTGDAMVDILCQLLRITDDDRPMSIVQLAGFPAETMEVVVSVLFRLAFEFGVWSDGLSPVLIVCEEAHNYANADHSVGFRSARDGLSRIAKEGRKHGVFLGLVTQRPHQLDPTLISQCSTVFAMRLGHEDDQKIVRAAVSETASRLLAFLPSLGTREALVIGAGVPTVMRLRFEALPDCFIPKSRAVWGDEIAARSTINEQLIATVVARWRGTAPAAKPAPEPVIPDLNLRSTDAVRWSAPYRD